MKAAIHSEADVRSALHATLRPRSEGGAEEYLVDEFWIPRSGVRADVAAVGQRLRAFEIKTHRDTLSRLDRQAQMYALIFEECTAVIADRHLTKAIGVLPSWWGLLLITGDKSVEFETVRASARNPDVDSQTLVRLLWRDEVFRLLVGLGETPPPKAGRTWMWESLLSLIQPDAVPAVVAEALLRRDPRRARIPTQRFIAQLELRVVR